MENRRSCVTLAFAVAIASVAGAAPVFGANADNGERLAQRWCAACHVVTPAQVQATADAPPFATIARMPGFSVEKLTYFLLEPHPKMPSMALTRADAADLAAYIGTLGK